MTHRKRAKNPFGNGKRVRVPDPVTDVKALIGNGHEKPSPMRLDFGYGCHPVSVADVSGHQKRRFYFARLH